ncbi:MAG TPA: FAD-dependent oxidoreductase [Acidobacteriaceae bacterium]|nr:FAD-dependent oxidoreductase [Acidobacteriaceae bacterium]
MAQPDGVTERVETRCCVTGGGPAGTMLAFLLARAGIDVVVLEKHADFLRDFRGDTIHPSTLELMYELGLLDEFLRRPHQQLSSIGGKVEGFAVTIADFSHLPTHCKFAGLMPQWEFLNFLAEQGKRYPQFHLRMEAEVTDLLQENGRIAGVRARTPQGSLEVRADLTIGADGRHSTVRQQAGFEVFDLGAPIDVLWIRLSRRSSDPEQTLGYFQAGRILVTLNRGDYWQCAYVIAKGSFAEIQKKGLAFFRQEIAQVAPFLASRTDELTGWNDVKLLTVAVDRLRQWYRPGLLCIGDSAHAMSPVGGVGINLAIQDAVAAANILAASLSRGLVAEDRLRQVQQRREFPTQMTQRMQVFLHRHFLQPGLENRGMRRAPLLLRAWQHLPWLRRIPARLVGLGFRPEHVHTPEFHQKPAC